jgi:hypothetical protein
VGELILLTFAAPAAGLTAEREAKAVQETEALMAAVAAAAEATSAEATSAAAGGVSGDAQQREQLELIASCDGAPALLRQVAAACSSRAPTPAELVSLTLAKPPSGWLPPRFAEALEDLGLPGHTRGEVFSSTSSQTLEALLELLRTQHASPSVHFCSTLVGEALAARYPNGAEVQRADAVRCRGAPRALCSAWLEQPRSPLVSPRLRRRWRSCGSFCWTRC